MKDKNLKLEAWAATGAEYAIAAASATVQYLAALPQRLGRYVGRYSYGGGHRARRGGIGQVRMITATA